MHVDMIDDERSVIDHGLVHRMSVRERPRVVLEGVARFRHGQRHDEGIRRMTACCFSAGMPIHRKSMAVVSPCRSNRPRAELLADHLVELDQNGLDLTLPYYFDVAPNYDLALTPRIMSKHGAMLNDNVRFPVLTSVRHERPSLYLPDNAIAEDRYAIRSASSTIRISAMALPHT